MKYPPNLRFITHTILLIAMLLPMIGHCQICIDEDLQKLDIVVEQSGNYEQAKQKEIARSQMAEGNCVTTMDKYNFHESLYRQYLKWNPDSAVAHARRCQEIASANNLPHLCTKAVIHEAYAKVLCGELLDATRLIQTIGPIESLDKENKTPMAILMLEFYLRTDMTGIVDRVNQKNLDNWNKYSVYLPKDHWRYQFYKVMLTQNGDTKTLIALLNHCKQPSYEAAAIAATIARLYVCQKDYNSFHHYLIVSAINDIECANHEAQSLVHLINSPYITLAPNRAYNYAAVYADNVKFFNDQGRSLNVVKAYTKITKAYQEGWQHRTYILYAIIALLAIAIIAIVYLLRKVNKKGSEQEKLLRQLEESNTKLEAMVAQRKEAQEELQKSNGLLQREISYHNQNFFNVYLLISKYITDVKEFKKKVYNLITAGKVDSARRELHANMQTDKYLKNFFEHFDKAFLLSHPDFVERFNALLRPEARITLEHEETLTPELRIYALVSIGITDSVSIAKFLHYSTQTVYNYRLKVRHTSCIPEKDFAETVASMYSVLATDSANLS